MTVVIIICACSDDEKAQEIGRRLVAEGHIVQIAHREVDYHDWRPGSNVCAVVLWSNNSKDFWPVREMARAADAVRSLVHVTLEPVTPPIPSPLAPIDFSRWRGERSSVWRLLRERIERVTSGGDARVATHHFYPVLATTATCLTMMGFAILLRMEQGAAPGQGAPKITPMQLTATAANIALPEGSAGGPTGSEDALEADEVKVEIIGARPLAPLRLPAMSILDAPRSLEAVEFRRRGLFGQILRAPAELLSAGEYRGPTV